MPSQPTFTGPYSHLVVFGESNVRGGQWLRSDDERWADILWNLLQHAQESPLDYYNAGVGASVISPLSPGYEASTKPSGMERVESEVIARNPDLVVVAYGLNDMRSGMEPESFIHEMTEIVERLQKSLSAQIVIADLYFVSSYDFYPPFNRGSREATQRYNELLRQLAESKHCIFADIWNAYGNCEHLVNPDTVHANKLGNLLVAHKVFAAIAQAAPGIAQNIRQRDDASAWAKRAAEICRKQVEESHPKGPIDA